MNASNIMVVCGNTQTIEYKTYSGLEDFRFGLGMIKRDNRYTYVVASGPCGGSDFRPFYAATKGAEGLAAASKWGQGDKLALVHANARKPLRTRARALAEGCTCDVCKVPVVPTMRGHCPYCEIKLTTAQSGV
jgi:hypothetical protein